MEKTNAIKWTDSQLNAITAENSTLLVSAAAGSGKTAVLTNRIIGKIIRDKCEITDFLIVTFTRAAATEMKNKIVKVLREKSAENPSDRHLRRQISRIGEAHISTIDSFCSSIIKENFNILGLPAKMRLMDEAESRVFIRRKVNEVLEKFYAEYDEKPESAFRLVVETLAGDRDDEGLVEAVTEIYKTVVSFPEPVKLLENANRRLADEIENHYRIGNGIFTTYWGKLLKNETETRLKNAEKCAAEADELCVGDEILEKNYRPAVSADLEFVRGLLFILESGTYTELRDAAMSYAPKSLKSAAKTQAVYEAERVRQLRGACKEILASLKTDLLVYAEGAVFEQCELSYKMCGILTDILRELVLSMRSEKLERHIMDFSDLSHFAFEALVKENSFDFESGSFEKTPLAEKITAEFTEIFIDEYQDTNLLQDTLFNAISNGRNLFMVGDLKQSIYRFRGADPSIFRKYKDNFDYYGSQSEKQKIFLSENFRSNGGVLDFVNLVFAKTMNVISPGSYIDEDMLVCTKEDAKIIPELHLFCKSPRGEGEKQTEKEAEWEFIAQKIIRFCDEGYNFGDIAVLARDSTELLQMKRILDKYEIPCVTDTRDSLFDKSEILMMLCILNTVDNPRRDIYYIGAMTSPFFGFTSDELYTIKLGGGGADCFRGAANFYRESNDDRLSAKISAFENTFSRWRELSAGVGVSQLIRTVYNDTSALSYYTDKSRADNLLSFYDFAKNFESKDLKGLFLFVSYVNDIIENGFSLNVPQENVNSIRLMTMHKSKGLEFPVCFVAGLNKQMNSRDLSGRMIVNKELGITLKHSDADGIVTYDTLLRKISAMSEKGKMLEEELRLLYVALTRAKERLILTATVSEGEAGVKSAISPSYDLSKARSHYDLIAAALKYDDAYRDLNPDATVYCDSLKINVAMHDCADGEKLDFEKREAVQKEIFDMDLSGLRFEYANSELQSVPQKLSVSELHLGLSDDVEEQATVTPYEAPAFINEKSHGGAARGTAMHTFVQFCDYAICAKKGCAYEGERLLNEAFITPKQYEMLDFKKLDGFFKSNLYEKIKNSRDVRREMRFNILVDGEKLSARAAGEKILVQGVIDCFFANADGSYTVVDFKTDRVRDAATLIERHRSQLEFYAYAVEAMTGAKVKETIIYSFEMSREIYL